MVVCLNLLVFACLIPWRAPPCVCRGRRIFIHFPFFWGPSWSKSSRISFPGIAVHPLGLSHPGSAWVPGSQASDTAAETARTWEAQWGSKEGRSGMICLEKWWEKWWDPCFGTVFGENMPEKNGTLGWWRNWMNIEWTWGCWTLILGTLMNYMTFLIHFRKKPCVNIFLGIGLRSLGFSGGQVYGEYGEHLVDQMVSWTATAALILMCWKIGFYSNWICGELQKN